MSASHALVDWHLRWFVQGSDWAVGWSNKGHDMRDWRPLTWVIVVVNILFLIWVISGIASTSGACEGLTGTELDACEAGTAIGATIGVAGIIIFWVFVDIILGIVWLVTNTKKRECPACGKKVKKGKTVCGNCGHNFATAASGGSQGQQSAPSPTPQASPEAGWYDNPEGDGERYWDGSAWTDDYRGAKS